MVFLIEMPKSIACDSKQRMRALNGAHEHIGVYEDFHLPAVWIAIFPTHSIRSLVRLRVFWQSPAFLISRCKTYSDILKRLAAVRFSATCRASCRPEAGTAPTSNFSQCVKRGSSW